MPLPFSILPFDSLRGINSRKSLTKKGANEAEESFGGFFDRRGSYVKRKGGEKFNTTEIGSEITGLFDFQYDNGASQKLLISAGTDIYEGGGGTPASIKTGLTSGLPTDFTDFFLADDIFETNKELAFITNGTDPMCTYDGTTVKTAGITRPGTAITAVGANTGGNLTGGGTYKLRFTFVNADGVESNPSDETSVTLGGGDDSISITNIIVSPDAQVTKRFIYMTTDGGETFFFNKELSDNVSTTDTITDESTGALLEFNHDVPPKLKFIETFRDRLVGAGDSEHPNRAYFSRQYRPHYWPQGELSQDDLFFFDLGDSKPITAVKVFLDYALFFKEGEIYVLNGDSELNYRIDRIKGDELIGCVADKSVIVYENWCYFLGPNGYYRTNAVQVQDVSRPLSDFFNKFAVDSDIKINKAAYTNSRATVDKENSLILLAMPTGSSTDNDTIFAMGVDNIAVDGDDLVPNWSIWDNLETTAMTLFKENGEDRWFRGETNGFIYKMNALDGDGSNITSTATSGGASTLTDTAQSLTVDLYKFITIKILSGTGAGQTRTISSNTADTFTVSVPWTTVPDSTSVYTVGGFKYSYAHSWNDYGNPSLSKRWRFVRPRFDTTGLFDVDITYGFDFSESTVDNFEFNLSDSSLWDVATWDVNEWDGTLVVQDKVGLEGSRIHKWSNFKIENEKAGQYIVYNGCDKIYQTKGIR